MAQQTKKKSSSVGHTIKKIRERKKISLDQVANDTGFSIQYLKNMENGKSMLPVAVLLQISKALGIDARSFLYESRSKKRKSAKEQVGITENYIFTALNPNVEHKHLNTFHVSIQGRKEHTGFGYQHEGEEFVFVLSGEVEVMVGEHRNALAEGESLHFNSMIPHKMRNLSKKNSELIVAIYTP